ncbi:hypothetical protein EBZ80_06710 [bacterium]|nr:hypothetical protein [bacterium]
MLNEFHSSRRAVFLLAISMALAASCKSRSRKTRLKGESAPCESVASTPAQLAVRGAIDQTIGAYLRGNIESGEATTAVSDAIQDAAADDPVNARNLGSIAAIYTESQVSRIIRGQQLAVLAGRASAADTSIIHSLGLTDADFNEGLQEMRPHWSCLAAEGVSLRPDGSITFLGSKVSGQRIASSSCLRDAIDFFFVVISRHPADALAINDEVIQNCANYAPMPRATWETNVKTNLAQFGRELQSFLRQTGNLASYTSLMQGSASWILGEGSDAGSPAGIGISGAYNAANKIRNNLECLGVPFQMRQELRNMMAAANDIEQRNIQSGLTKLRAAENAAYAAPFIPLTMYSAPFIAGAILPGTTAAATAASTSGALALTPFAFGSGLSVVNAAVDTGFNGGSFFCKLGEEFRMQGAGALTTAPFLAALPAVTTTGGAAIGYFGQAGELSTIFGIQALNSIAGLAFTVGGIATGSQELLACHATLNDARQLAETVRVDADVAAVDAKIAEAVKQCATGGFNIAMTASTVRTQYQQFRELRALALNIGTAGGTIRSVADLDATLKPYYGDKGREAWVEFGEAAQANGKRLGGKAEGAYLYQTPEGQQVVAKTITVQNDELAILGERFGIATGWEQNGMTARITGAGIKDLGGGKSRITIVQEFFFDKGTNPGLLAGGDGNAISKLNSVTRLGDAARAELIGKITSLLDSHPDGHLGNVLFRVTTIDPAKTPGKYSVINGDKVIELALIDPTTFSSVGTSIRGAARRAEILPNQLPPFWRKYNRIWQANFLNEVLAGN